MRFREAKLSDALSEATKWWNTVDASLRCMLGLDPAWRSLDWYLRYSGPLDHRLVSVREVPHVCSLLDGAEYMRQSV